MALAGKTKHEVVSEFRCAEILTAARKVFAGNGYNDATVDQIALAAGLAKGTIYLYFSSKKDIYLEALKEGLAELRERTRQKMQAEKGIRDKLRAFIATRVEYAEDNRDFIRIYHAEFGNLSNPAVSDREFQSLYLQQAKELQEVLETAVKTGEIRPVRADFTAFLIYDMVKTVMTQRLLHWSKAPIQEDIALLDTMIWKGLAC